VAAQLQSPAHVPTSSIAAVSSQIAAKSSPRRERRTHQTRSGNRIRPWTSQRCVSGGSTVTPASAQVVAAATTPRFSNEPFRRTSGSDAAVTPNTNTSACPGGT
jgi:hypothetical protein